MREPDQLVTDILTAIDRGQEIRLYRPKDSAYPSPNTFIVEVLFRDEDGGCHTSYTGLVDEISFVHVGSAVLGYAIATASEAIEKVASEEPYELEVE